MTHPEQIAASIFPENRKGSGNVGVSDELQNMHLHAAQASMRGSEPTTGCQVSRDFAKVGTIL